MKLIVSMARSGDDHRDATNLLKSVYLSEFSLDFDQFKKVFPLEFPTGIMIIRDDEGTLLGTASVMSPVNGLFPSEYIFGTRIRDFAMQKAIGQTIEVGRLAKSSACPGGLATKAIMLGTAALLKSGGYQGWVATVRPTLHRILTMSGLDIDPIEIAGEKSGIEEEIVEKYKGGGVRSFWASAATTLQAFSKVPAKGPGYEIELRL